MWVFFLTYVTIICPTHHVALGASRQVDLPPKAHLCVYHSCTDAKMSPYFNRHQHVSPFNTSVFGAILVSILGDSTLRSVPESIHLCQYTR